MVDRRRESRPDAHSPAKIFQQYIGISVGVILIPILRLVPLQHAGRLIGMRRFYFSSLLIFNFNL